MFNYYNPIEHLKPEEIIMYLRKSRADDPLLTVAEVLSKHETRLNEWIERNLPYPIPDENRFKEIVSGGDSIADRPEFQKVLKLIESPEFRAILVLDIDRLGRPDTEEIGRLTKILRYTNTLVITPSMIFDITNEYQRDGFERELKRGQEELDRTKKRLRAGRELSVKSGNYVLSRALYGYDKITITDDKRKCPTLTINEEQANVVRMIFDWYVNENIGTQTISNRLNDLRIAPPKGVRWTPDSIRNILENPHYIGMVRFNNRKAVLVLENGEFRKTRPKTTNGEAILCKGKHEAIISDELFQAAQEKRGRTHRTCSKKELKNPLASILFCKCGRAMSYRCSTRGEGKLRKDPRLVCNGQVYCGTGSATVDEVMEFVVDILKQKIAEIEVEIEKGNKDTDMLHEKLVKSLEKKLVDLGAKELSLWESQLDTENRMPPHIFQALTDKIVKEREETEIALKKAQEALSKPLDYEKARTTFQKALASLLDDNVSALEKNKLLKSCISRIEYHRDKPQRVLGKGKGRAWETPPIELDVKLMV